MTQTTKTDRRKALQNKITETHDMEERGLWQWEACGVHTTYQCTICGLTHDAYYGGQNSPDLDEYSDFHEKKLSLAEAAAEPCGDVLDAAEHDVEH